MNYTPSSSLIPCGLPTIQEMYKKYKLKPQVKWATFGRPPILKTNAFISMVEEFEIDKSRAVSKNDLKSILKNAKEKKRKAMIIPYSLLNLHVEDHSQTILACSHS